MNLMRFFFACYLIFEMRYCNVFLGQFEDTTDSCESLQPCDSDDKDDTDRLVLVDLFVAGHLNIDGKY